MDPVRIRIQDVLDALQAVGINSDAGPDELHPALLKGCSGSQVPGRGPYPLHKIFCLSLSERRLPLKWKTFKVGVQ